MKELGRTNHKSTVNITDKQFSILMDIDDALYYLYQDKDVISPKLFQICVENRIISSLPKVLQKRFTKLSTMLIQAYKLNSFGIVASIIEDKEIFLKHISKFLSHRDIKVRLTFPFSPNTKHESIIRCVVTFNGKKNKITGIPDRLINFTFNPNVKKPKKPKKGKLNRLDLLLG